MPFQKGNAWGKAGRPKGSTNRIGKIRDRILRILERRIMREKDLDTVQTGDLIKFVGGIIPKDVSLALTRDPQITYISNVPRPQIGTDVKAVVAGEVENEHEQDSEAGN